MARPTKLNQATQNKLVKLIKTGVSVEDACSFVGIGESTFYDWQQRGENGEDGFAEFSEAVKRARSAAKVKAVNTLHAALSPTVGKSRTKDTFTETRLDSFGHETQYQTVKEHEVETVYPADWRAAVEYLKRRYPGEWSEKRILELGLTDDLLKRIEAVAKQADMPASELFEAMLNALAAELAESRTTDAGAADE